MTWMAARLALFALAGAVALGAGGASPRVTLTAPATTVAGLPFTVTARVTPAPRGRVDVQATLGAQRVLRAAQGARGTYRARVALPAAGRWTLSVRVDGGVRGGRGVRAVPPKIALPFSVTVARGVVFVGDATSGRVIRFGSRGPVVHASGLVEPTGLAPAPTGGLYAADFAAGVVRRVAANGRVSALARLPQVTSVAPVDSDVYAVTLDGELARISSRGAVTRIPVPGGLDRPHGIVVDRDGSLLIGEDSRRVRRVDPASGRATLVVGDVDTNKIAVAADGTLFLAGSTLTGGTLRRLTPGGVLSTLISGLRVSDVAVLPDGDVVITTVEPAAVLRVDPRTGARRPYAP